MQQAAQHGTLVYLYLHRNNHAATFLKLGEECECPLGGEKNKGHEQVAKSWPRQETHKGFHVAFWFWFPGKLALTLVSLLKLPTGIVSNKHRGSCSSAVHSKSQHLGLLIINPSCRDCVPQTIAHSQSSLFLCLLHRAEHAPYVFSTVLIGISIKTVPEE